MHKLFVYGTLRNRYESLGQHEIEGVLLDLSWFPGIILGIFGPKGAPLTVKADLIKVSDEELKRLDAYEGYYPDDEKRSLFIRKNCIATDGRCAQIYEYNPALSKEAAIREHGIIESGDWFDRSSKTLLREDATVSF